MQVCYLPVREVHRSDHTIEYWFTTNPEVPIRRCGPDDYPADFRISRLRFAFNRLRFAWVSSG